MCRAVNCTKCGKATWSGCGAHVEQVLGHVPRAERCQCREQAAAKGGEGKRPSLWSLLSGKDR